MRGVLNHAGPSQLLAPPGRTFHCVINLVGDVSEPLFFYCLLLLLASSLPYRLCFIFLLHTNSLSFVTSLAGEKMKEKKQKGKKIKTPVCRIAHRQRKGQRGSKCEAAAFCFKRADVCNFWLDRGGGHRKTSTLGGPARPTCAEVTPLCSTRTSSSPLFC